MRSCIIDSRTAVPLVHDRRGLRLPKSRQIADKAAQQPPENPSAPPLRHE
jgi:hypothetical protein